MRLGSIIRTSAFLLAGIGLSGCQYSPGIAERSTAFNQAIAAANNRLLLQNIVRASERQPTYYSRIQADTAAGSVSPSLGLSFPLTKSFSFDNNAGATGVTASTKASSALAAMTGSFSMSSPMTNTLTLQTMDDMKYQAGMMKALDFTQLKGYFDEGFSRDILMLMFIAKIRLKADLVDKLDAVITERCAERDPDSLCRYIQSDPYKANFAGGGWREHWSLGACVRHRGALPNPANDTVDFLNDPAREILPEGGTMARADAPHPQMCFEMLLEDLFVLGLDITPGGNLSSEIIDARVPVKVAEDPGFRVEMMKQNTRIVALPDGSAVVLCRRKPESVAFTLMFDHPMGTLQDDLVRRLKGDLKATRLDAANDVDAGICTDAGKPSFKRDDQPGVRRVGPRGRNEPVTAAKPPPAAAPAPSEEAPIRLVAKDIAFTERSFEGMIYYLGEIVRADEGGIDPSLIVRVHGRNPEVTGPTYTEALFYASSTLDSSDAVLSVKADGGKVYHLASLCPKSLALATPKKGGAGCSVEYPDNESITVLALLNQIWGLQKEYTGPAAPPAILANPQ